MRVFLVVLLAACASGCSIFESGGDEIIFDTTLGPLTETQIEALPSGLVGDTERRNYGGAASGEDMEDARPGGNG